MKHIIRIASLVIVPLFVGCSVYYPPTVPTGGGNTEQRQGHNEEDELYAFVDMGIPKGHLPPPGECKVWFPDRPAGHQPPPQSCSSAFRDRPLGAWVITHEAHRFRVVTFVRTERGITERIRYYRDR